MALTFEAAKAILALLKAAPIIQAGLRKWKGRPTPTERSLLAAYARRLDERRVFSAPFNVEIVELCLGSLNEVRRLTDEVLAEVEHPGARAMIGAILDATRHSHDKWHWFRTPDYLERWRHRADTIGRHPGEADLAGFFEDLGELRGTLRLVVGALAEIEPDVKAPNLLQREDSAGDYS